MNNSTVTMPSNMPMGDPCWTCHCMPCICYRWPPTTVFVPYPVLTPALPLYPAKRTIELSDDEAKALADALRLLADKLDPEKGKNR